jgi:hypothetical protein
MANSQDHDIIPRTQDALQEKWVSEHWDTRFSPFDCQTTEKPTTSDNWKTTTIIKRKTFHNKTTGHRAKTREFTKDGKPHRIILMLEDETGKYVYNGTPATV